MTQCVACGSEADHVGIFVPWEESGRILVLHRCRNQVCPHPSFAEPVRDLAAILHRVDVNLARCRPPAATSLAEPARPVLPAPPAPKPAPPAPAPPPAPIAVPADVQGEASVAVVVRALADIPPFVDPNLQTITLKKGDLASVPPRVADLLVRRGKAARVEPANLQPEVPA